MCFTEKVQSRNKVYYSKFPEDEDRVRLIVSYLKSKTVQFPDGSSLTPERFLQLGIHFGMKGVFCVTKLLDSLANILYVGGVDLVHSTDPPKDNYNVSLFANKVCLIYRHHIKMYQRLGHFWLPRQAYPILD